MDAGLLDVLHHPADHHGLAVGNGVDVDLDRALEEPIDQDRAARRHHRAVLAHVAPQVVLVVDDLHRPAAEHEARPDEHRVTDPLGDAPRLVHRAGDTAGRLPQAEPFDQRRKLLTVFGVFDRVDVYDPVTNTWRLEAPMPTARHGVHPVLFESRIFVVGGAMTSGDGESDVVEVFSRR